MGKFFENLWNYLYDAYFNMGKEYGNLGADGNHLFSVGVIVFGVYIGCVIACIVISYNRQVVGSAARKILEKEIFSRDKAQTISSLGFKNNFLIKSFFRDNASLKRVVKCVEEEDFYAEQEQARIAYEEKRKENKKLPKFKEEVYRVDVSNDHFYIPEELIDTANKRFEKKGSTWLSVIIGIIMLTVLLFAVLLVLPWILGHTDSVFGGF